MPAIPRLILEAQILDRKGAVKARSTVDLSMALARGLQANPQMVERWQAQGRVPLEDVEAALTDEQKRQALQGRFFIPELAVKAEAFVQKVGRNRMRVLEGKLLEVLFLEGRVKMTRELVAPALAKDSGSWWANEQIRTAESLLAYCVEKSWPNNPAVTDDNFISILDTLLGKDQQEPPASQLSSPTMG